MLYVQPFVSTGALVHSHTHAMRTFPPCERDTTSATGVVCTVVAKIRGGFDYAAQWASLQTDFEQTVGAVALVKLDADQGSPVLYIVLTENTPKTLGNVVTRIKRMLTGPSTNVNVEWVRALDRRLTRLFGWGDVWADSDHLERAVKEDSLELKRCLPALSTIIDNGETHHIANVLCGVSKRGLQCLTDASRGDDPMEQTTRLRMQHELEGTHIFGEPGKHWDCTVCRRLCAARCVCVGPSGASST